MQTWSRSTALVALVLVVGGGCRSVVNLSLSPIERPMRLALVTENPAELINPFSPYDPLLNALSQALGKRVRLEPAFPIQVDPQLGTGSYMLALATPAQLATFRHVDEAQILAVAATSRAEVATPAVLLVRADSEIESVEDLAGKRVALAAETDSRSYHAARCLLREHGVKRADLAANPLLLETLTLSQRNALARVRLVLDGSVDATFIDEREWNRFPAEEERADEPCRKKLRVVARTAPVSDLLVLASPALPEALAAAIRTFLVESAAQRPELLEPLPYAGFWPADDVVRDGCARLRAVISSVPTTQPTTAPAEGQASN